MTLLANAITTQITDLVNEPEAVDYLFSTADHVTKTYVWNPSSWAYPLKHRVNCRAVYNSWYGTRDGPTLIDVAGDRRFAVHCWHFHKPSMVGKKAWWQDEDGVTVHERTIVDERIVEWSEGVPSDLRILMFNSALPSTVYAARVLPPHEQAVRKVGSWDRVPCFTVAATNANLTMRGIVRELSDVPGWHTYQTSPSYAFSDFSSPVGASGSPLFLLIDDQLVLLWCWGGAIVGDQLQRFRDNAEAALSDMAGAARVLVEVDLSGYDNAPPVLIFSPPVASIPPGGEIDLFYWASYTDELIITPGDITVEPLTGHQSVSPSIDTTYTLTAIVDSEPIATAELTVNILPVPPSITFESDDYNILVGESATLSWLVSGLGLETIELFENGTIVSSVTAEDELVVSPQATTHYRIEATGSGGFNARTVQIIVSENEGETLVSTYYWDGTDAVNEGAGEGNISVVTNYSTSNEELIPPASLPGPGDTVEKYTGGAGVSSPSSGTSDADWNFDDISVAGGTFNGSSTFGVSVISGGIFADSTFDSPGWTIGGGTFGAITVGESADGQINDGTFNGTTDFSNAVVSIEGGEFNDSITGGVLTIGTGTPVFNGTVSANAQITVGEFNDATTVTGGGGTGGTAVFNGPLKIGVGANYGGGTINYSLEIEGGTSDGSFGPLYPLTSPAVGSRVGSTVQSTV